MAVVAMERPHSRPWFNSLNDGGGGGIYRWVLPPQNVPYVPICAEALGDA